MKTILILMLSAVCAFGQGGLLGYGSRNPALLMSSYRALTSNEIYALGPKQWLMADVGCYSNNGVNVCTDGVGCQRWLDQSGNGNNAGQTTFARQPKFKSSVVNGFPALLFGGGTWVMTNTYPSPFVQPVTIFIVLLSSNNAASGSIIVGPSSIGTQMWFDSSSRLVMYAGSTQPTVMIPQVMKWHQFSLVYQYPVWMYANANCKRKMQLYGISSGSSSMNGLNLGASNVPNNPFQGMICEFMLFNKILPPDLIHGIELYLKQKYALPDPF